MNFFACQSRWRTMALGFLKMKQAEEKDWLALFERGERLLFSHQVALPVWTCRAFPLQSTEKGICCEGSSLCLKGESIRRHLEGCSMGMLFCLTLGAGADRAVAKAQAEDMALAVVTDALASAMAECACDLAVEEIMKDLFHDSYEATDRFSPGYGDLSLKQQKGILRVLNASRRVGVSVSEGDLLVPRKTVTAVIGLKEKKK